MINLNIPFMSYRNIATMTSLALLALSILSLGFRGLPQSFFMLLEQDPLKVLLSRCLLGLLPLCLPRLSVPGQSLTSCMATRIFRSSEYDKS